MAIAVTLPFGEKDNLKNILFSILSREHPLKLIELTNFVRKRYGRSVTFQAVRKAILLLVAEGVLQQEGHAFFIRLDWVRESKATLDNLYLSLTHVQKTPRSLEAIGGEISVFTFECLKDLMKFWEDLVDDWIHAFKKGNPNMNCYQGYHLWEGLLYPDQERLVWSTLLRKGVRCYSLTLGTTSLDRFVTRFYKSLGLKSVIVPAHGLFDKSYYVATYGELVIQTQYPARLTKLLESFFGKHKSMDDVDLNELSKIVNMRIPLKLTVIKNQAMAEQINKSILVHFS